MDLGTNDQHFDLANCVELASLASTAWISSPEFLRSALQLARVGTWQVDLITGLSTWDAVASEMVGLPAAPMTAGKMLPIHPDDRGIVEERFASHSAVGGADAIDFRVVRPSGEVRWLHATGERLDEAQENPRYIAGIVIDITEARISLA